MYVLLFTYLIDVLIYRSRYII